MKLVILVYVKCATCGNPINGAMVKGSANFQKKVDFKGRTKNGLYIKVAEAPNVINTIQVSGIVVACKTIKSFDGQSTTPKTGGSADAKNMDKEMKDFINSLPIDDKEKKSSLKQADVFNDTSYFEDKQRGYYKETVEFNCHENSSTPTHETKQLETNGVDEEGDTNGIGKRTYSVESKDNCDGSYDYTITSTSVGEIDDVKICLGKDLKAGDFDITVEPSSAGGEQGFGNNGDKDNPNCIYLKHNGTGVSSVKIKIKPKNPKKKLETDLVDIQVSRLNSPSRGDGKGFGPVAYESSLSTPAKIAIGVAGAIAVGLLIAGILLASTISGG